MLLMLLMMCLGGLVMCWDGSSMLVVSMMWLLTKSTSLYQSAVIGCRGMRGRDVAARRCGGVVCSRSASPCEGSVGWGGDVGVGGAG